jgi:hypothetical protein
MLSSTALASYLLQEGERLLQPEETEVQQLLHSSMSESSHAAPVAAEVKRVGSLSTVPARHLMHLAVLCSSIMLLLDTLQPVEASAVVAEPVDKEAKPAKGAKKGAKKGGKKEAKKEKVASKPAVCEDFQHVLSLHRLYETC